MGRPKARIRHRDIIEAEARFTRSQKVGDPDWRLVALAVGERPHDPPAWAVQACMELHNQELIAASRQAREGGELNSLVIGYVLDRIVEHYHAAELQAEEATGKHVWESQDDGHPVYTRPPFDRIVISACREAGVLNDAVDDANRDSIRLIRKAWDDEQEQTTLTFEKSTHFLEGWLPTQRIERVLSDLGLEAAGLPVNISQGLWLRRES